MSSLLKAGSAAVIVALLAAPALSAKLVTSTADRQFVMKAAAGGTEEVRNGQAERNSPNANARTFAVRMVRDHSKGNAQLMTLAQELGLTAVAREGVAMAAAAKMLPGNAYLVSEIGDHQKTIALFEQEAAHGTNPNLRAFANTTLPMLRTHLQLAQSLSRKK